MKQPPYRSRSRWAAPSSSWLPLPGNRVSPGRPIDGEPRQSAGHPRTARTRPWRRRRPWRWRSFHRGNSIHRPAFAGNAQTPPARADRSPEQRLSPHQRRPPCQRTPALTAPHRRRASPAWHTLPASPQPSRPPTPSWSPRQPLPGAWRPAPAAIHPTRPTPAHGAAHGPSPAPAPASWLRAQACGSNPADHAGATSPALRSIAANR